MAFSLVIARSLHWTACLLLVSSQLSRLWLLPRNGPTERPDGWAWPAEFFSGLRALARAAWALALISLMFWFGLTVWDMTGSDAGLDLPSICTVATQTQFGRVFLARLAVLTLAGVCVFSADREAAAEAGPGWRVAALALALVNLLALALTGHAAATPGPAGLFHIVVDALHLAAVAVWPGGLVCFALLLRCALYQLRIKEIV